MTSETLLYGAMLDRETVALSGPAEEQADFLQSLVTNDVSKAAEDRLVYAALLTPQGKYLSDFFLRRDGAGNFLIDVAAPLAEALEKRLTMYRLRRPVALSRAPQRVLALWGDGEAPAGALADPRDPALGWRAYGNAAEALRTDTVDGDYDLHRLTLGIPESGTDLIVNDSYVLEAGFERLNGVDFRKGCYVGQEIVARMKHKTELRKGYRRVSVAGRAKPGETVITGDGRPAGALYSNRDGIGLALLRLDRAEGAEFLNAGDAKLELLRCKTDT